MHLQCKHKLKVAFSQKNPVLISQSQFVRYFRIWLVRKSFRALNGYQLRGTPFSTLTKIWIPSIEPVHKLVRSCLPVCEQILWKEFKIQKELKIEMFVRAEKRVPLMPSHNSHSMHRHSNLANQVQSLARLRDYLLYITQISNKKLITICEQRRP